MSLNDDILDIEEPDGICSLTFVVKDLKKITFMSINLFRFKICIDYKCCFIRFIVWIKILYLSVFRRHHKITKIFYFDILFYVIQVYFLIWMNKDNWNNENHNHVLMLLLLLMQIIFYCKIIPSFSVWNH